MFQYQYCIAVAVVIASCGCDSSTLHLKQSFSTPWYPKWVNYSPSGSDLSIIANDGIYVLNMPSKKLQQLIYRKGCQSCLAFFENETMFLYVDGETKLVDRELSNVTSTIDEYVFVMDCVSIGKSHILLVGTDSIGVEETGQPTILSVKDGKFSDSIVLPGCSKAVSRTCAAAHTEHGYRIAIGYLGDCPAEIYDLQIDSNGKLTIQNNFILPQSSLCLKMSSNATRIASWNGESIVVYAIDENGRYQVLDVDLTSPIGKRLQSAKLLGFETQFLALSSDGSLLAWADEDGIVAIDLNTGEKWSSSTPAACIAISPDGKSIAAGCPQRVNIYDVTPKK